MNPVLSIIIPTHNSESTIKRCINSLTCQLVPREQFEIIIVDDGSSDRTVSIAEESGSDSVLTIASCFQGKARNVGARIAKAEFLAFIDSDCIAKQGWIKTILSELKNLEAITGSIENGNTESKVAWGEYLIEFGGWDEYRHRSLVRFIPGCNQAYTKNAFEKTKGFIENPSSEDILFGESLRKVGIAPMFVPSMRISHLCRTDKEKALKNMKLLGKYSVRARKENPSIAYSSIMTSRKLIPVLFIIKIIKAFHHSINARKVTKFIASFPFIVQEIASFCKGSWEEIKDIGNDKTVK